MPKVKGGLSAVPGFRSFGLHCGIKSGRLPDLAVITAEEPCPAAAVFTTNRVKAAPVLVTQKHIRDGKLQAIVVNSGMANACTGKNGLIIAQKMAQITGAELGISPYLVAVSSTGKIGVVA